jgi:putative transposase
MGGGDLSRFINWLTLTHTQRWHQHHRHTVRAGHVYQGRFESFPVETSEYLLTVCHCMERNPGCAGWSSEQSSAGTCGSVLVHAWPMERPTDWFEWVNEGEATEQLGAVQKCVTKGQPFGCAL